MAVPQSEIRRVPFHGADELARRKESPVLIVSREQHDVARRLLPAFVILSAPVGEDVLDIDAAELQGRDVVLWVDGKDEWELDGVLSEVVSRLSVRLRTLRGNAATDLEAMGWTTNKVIGWAKENAKQWGSGNVTPIKSSDPEPETYLDTSETWVPPARNGIKYDLRPWQTPIDIFGEMRTPDLHPDWLPEPIRAYVWDQATLLGCDPGSVALGCLVAAATCIDDKIKLQPKHHDYGWQESARIWGAVVAEPSSKKTPALKRGIAHLNKIDVQWQIENEGKMKKHAKEMRLYVKREKAHVAAEASGRTVGTLDEAPEPPPIKRLVVNDSTVEALAQILKDNPRGVMVFRDELSGWFGSFDGYRGNLGAAGMDRASWLEFYNGGPRRIDRIGRGSQLVPNWGGCILGGIQPNAIRKLAKYLPEDGLMQRFIFVCPKGDGDEQDRAPDRAALERWRAVVDQLVSIIPGENPVRMSDGATEVRLEFETDRKTLLQGGLLNEAARVALGKWDGLFARLCLTFHCIECADSKRHPQDHTVSRETASMVREIMMRYLLHHAWSMYHEILGTSERMTHVRWIGGHILSKACSEFSQRDILRAYSKWGETTDLEQREIMNMLEDSGWVQGVHTRPGGPPKRWVVNPSVHEVWQSVAAAERAKRAELRARCLSLLKGVDSEPE